MSRQTNKKELIYIDEKLHYDNVEEDSRWYANEILLLDSSNLPMHRDKGEHRTLNQVSHFGKVILDHWVFSFFIDSTLMCLQFSSKK